MNVLPLTKPAMMLTPSSRMLLSKWRWPCTDRLSGWLRPSVFWLPSSDSVAPGTSCASAMKLRFFTGRPWTWDLAEHGAERRVLRAQDARGRVRLHLHGLTDPADLEREVDADGVARHDRHVPAAPRS